MVQTQDLGDGRAVGPTDPSPVPGLGHSASIPIAPHGSAELTLNDLALALAGVQLAQGWWQKDRPRSGYRSREMATLKALNAKLTAILDKFSLPRGEDDEVPDNGEDRVTLTWERQHDQG